MILPGARAEPAGNPRFGAAANEVGPGDFAKKSREDYSTGTKEGEGAPGIVIAAIKGFPLECDRYVSSRRVFLKE